ncbi:zinc ribbon domain-containing protein [Haloterrigena sp. SYSU A558-1]|uniref:Zinc ribbon domain-containing protein n=1 Tax=Haloterrigena gelatinilytica TaxID=2741724 RepID=A0ABX2LBX2_9EURY|nr:zinc ribbon domain-containing protein [Haloterrigena gelatinilytica]NUC73764.1 zinc ribbon domain-containing protein [Haloterrigena gelatinilytica]
MVSEHCPNCGASLSPTANYCSECGEAVSDDDSWESAGTDRSRDAADDSWGSSSAAGSWDESDDSWSDSRPEYASSRRSNGDTTLAAITHVLALVTWAIGPLIVLVATEDPFVEENARNALNWQIAFTIYMIVSFFLTFIVVGIVPFLVLPVVDLVFCVVAAVKAADGEAWSYPITPDIV